MDSKFNCSDIGIVGAGIAGMTLAAILSKMNNPPNITVFERDSRDKDQGTGFDIEKNGQKVLKKAGVFHKYYEFSRKGSDITRLYKPNEEKAHFVITTPKILKWFIPPSPESNRQQLREALIESSQGNVTVNFNCNVTKIIQNDKQAKLFGNDDICLGNFDLIIDASGFGSTLRKYRIENEDDETRFNSYYTGISMCHGLIYNPDSKCDPKIMKKLGEGSMMCVTKGIAFGLQRYGASEEDKRTSFYYMFPTEDMSFLSEKFHLPRKTIFHTDKDILDNIKEWIKKNLTKYNFSKDYFSVVDNIDAISIRPLMQHPQNPTFNDNSTLPVILIGDALHAMPPYTGAGGNFALDDAGDLSDYIIKNNSTITIKDLRNLEKKFLKRAVSTMKRGNSTKDKLIKFDRKFKNGEVVPDYGLMDFGLLFFYYFNYFYMFL